MNSQTTNISRPLQIKTLVLFVMLAFPSTHLSAQEPQPWIKSSFDGIKYDNTLSNVIYPKLVGTDSVTGYKWMPSDGNDKYDTDLPGAYQQGFSFLVSNSHMADDGSDGWQKYVRAGIQNVPGPDGKNVNSLYYRYIDDDPDKISMSRCQFQLIGAGSINPSENYTDKEWLREFYYTFYIKMNFSGGSDWALISESKGHNNNLSGGMGRWQIGVSGFSENPRWYMYVLEGQTNVDPLVPGSKKWDYDAPVPDNKWVKLEVYVRNSWNDDGFMRIAINGVESNALKYSGPTLYKDYAPGSFGVLKRYGAKGEQWFTHFEMWDKPPVTSVLSSENKGDFIITPGVLKPL